MSETEKIEMRCRFCSSDISVTVRTEALSRWDNGELIQDAMPELSADTREMLISGTCPRCWDAAWEPLTGVSK